MVHKNKIYSSKSIRIQYTYFVVAMIEEKMNNINKYLTHKCIISIELKNTQRKNDIGKLIRNSYESIIDNFRKFTFDQDTHFE